MAQSYAAAMDVGVRAALAEAGVVMVRRAKGVLNEEGRNYTEATKSGLYADTSATQAGYRMRFGTRSPHGIVVHEGRRPGQKPPPYKPIERWARLKVGKTGKELKSFARAVQVTIGRRGTEGTPFLTKPFNAEKDRLPSFIASEAAASLNSRI